MRLLLLLALVAGSLGADIHHVPTDAPVYEDLDLLRVAGYIRTMPATSRPWTRAVISRMAFEADSLSSGRELAPGLRAALARVVRDYPGRLVSPGPGPRRPLLDLPVTPAGSDARFRADLFSRPGVTGTEYGSRLFGSAGVVLENRPGGDFAFYERGEFLLFWPDTIEVHNPDSSGRYVPGTRVHAWKNGLGIFELEHAWLAFRLPWQLRLAIGRDRYRWGPGYTGAVMLGDEAPALDHFGLVADYGRFKYQSLTAYLSRWRGVHRFASWQRLELELWDRLRLGGVLSNVYAWDSTQTLSFFGMMNPLIPIYLEVANSGHHDNLLVGWDAVLDLAPFRVYGTLFLDNYEFIRRPTVPNATAAQVGARWAPNLPFDLRTEYVGIAPFTYYHRIHHVMYENFSVPMGHGLGPDAALYDLRVGIYPLEPLRLVTFGRLTRRGYYNRGDYERRSWIPGTDWIPQRYPSAGKDASEPLQFPDDLEVENELSLGFEVDYRPWRDLRLIGGFSLSRVEHAEGVTDESRTGYSFGFRLEYRY